MAVPAGAVVFGEVTLALREKNPRNDKTSLGLGNWGAACCAPTQVCHHQNINFNATCSWRALVVPSGRVNVESDSPKVLP